MKRAPDKPPHPDPLPRGERIKVRGNTDKFTRG